MVTRSANSCELHNRACVPCREGVPPLAAEQIAELVAEIDGWTVEQAHHLTKTYVFDDFASALAFVNRIGEVAEREGHHPDVALSWGKVRVDLWTHKINGLTMSDFILAAKCDGVR